MMPVARGATGMAQPNDAMHRQDNGPASRMDHRAPRADPLAAAILLVAGAIGLWQLLLPWRTTTLGSGGSDPGNVSTTGWQVCLPGAAPHSLRHRVPVDVQRAKADLRDGSGTKGYSG